MLFSSLMTDLKNGVEIRTYSESGYRYLRVSDLGQYSIENDNTRRVDVDGIPDKIKLTDNSFLISRSGSLGLVSVVEGEIKDAILSSHIFKVDLDATKIQPEYLEAFFRSQIGQFQFFQNNNGGVIPEISQTALKSIRVVLPPPEIQNNIAEIMQSAYTTKKRKDQKADALLDSIDDYLLTELGIEMPAVEKQMCFVVYANETIGRRIGARFHHRYFLRLRERLHNSSFPVKNLGDLTSLSYRYLNCYGFSFYDFPSDTRVPFLQVGDINATGISDENLIFIENEISEKYPKTILESGDLIFSVRGTIGKVAIVTREFENSNINPNLIRLSLDDRVNPQYVEIVLNSKIGQEQINRLISGGVQPTITKPDILSLEIPLPLLEIQEQISEEALRLRSEATRLRQEADTIVEAAKEEIVSILLAQA